VIATRIADHSDDASRPKSQVDPWRPDAVLTPCVYDATHTSFVSAGLATISLHFTDPVDIETFSLSEDIHSLMGPSSLQTITGYTWIDNYTLLLTVLSSELGEYTLSVGPYISTAAGESLDGDRDGTIGEHPEDIGRLNFRVTPPKVVLVETMTQTTQGSIIFTFDRAMAGSSFSIQDDVLEFEGPNGPVTVDAADWADLNTLILSDLSVAGEYQLTLGPDIRDPGGNQLDLDDDLIDGENPDDLSINGFTILGPSVESVNYQKVPPVNKITIKFDHPMDATSFSPEDDVIFTGPLGEITISDATWLDDFTLELRCEDQDVAGPFTFELSPTLTDIFGNALDCYPDGHPGEPNDGYTLNWDTLTQGTITENTAWSAPGGVIRIDGEIQIAADVTLRIDAGTTLKFTGASAGIVVNASGRLISSGTPNNPKMIQR